MKQFTRVTIKPEWLNCPEEAALIFVVIEDKGDRCNIIEEQDYLNGKAFAPVNCVKVSMLDEINR